MNIGAIGYAGSLEVRSVELNVRHNGEKVDFDLVEVETLGGFLVKLREERFKPREFITSIAINGEKISETQQTSVLHKPLSEIESLAVDSDTPVSISLRTIEKTDELMQALLGLIEESAEKFRIEDESIANQHFVKVVEGLQTFVEVLTKLKTLNSIDMTEIVVGSEPASNREETLYNIFNSLHENQVNKDWINLADILEYELAANIADWREVLAVVSDYISNKDN